MGLDQIKPLKVIPLVATFTQVQSQFVAGVRFTTA